MIRYCPNCRTERSVTELFCEGSVGEGRCAWPLFDLPVQAEGWRPAPVVTMAEAEAGDAAPLPPVCERGHAMDPQDLICLQCGADPAGTRPHAPLAAPDHEADAAAGETVIGGWHLLRPLSTTTGLRDRYLAEEPGTGRRGVLTLYHHGAEPDPAIYEVLARLPREHVPEVFATGRWNERAYEVAEELTGGTLAELGIVAGDAASVRRIVHELGRALQAFSEVGLRHRDIRPGTLLVRRRDPLDLVIGGFGSARLSEHDLDIVSPLETTRYMAPEAIAGGVAAASDWWSLGMVLLEQLTAGACFEGVHPQAYLIHVLANGVSLPEGLDPSTELLLRGLLARDRHQRWQWPQVQDWLDGKPVPAPARAHAAHGDAMGPSIVLAGVRQTSPAGYALAAAEAAHWDEARDQLLRGVLASWVQEAGFAPQMLAALRQVSRHEGLDDDARLMLALKLLNAEMPLIHRGEIVTPRWLLDHPLQGHGLVTGAVPDLLEQLGTERWLARLKARAGAVRQRAHNLGIELDEETLRVHLLVTSRPRLAAEWETRRRLLPDTGHPGLLGLVERRSLSEEDLIVVLSAALGQFRSCEAIVEEARLLARLNGVQAFDDEAAHEALRQSRADILQQVAARTEGFARCGIDALDGWADQFRLEKRLSLARALVLLSLPAAQWMEPQKQQYISQILGFFERKISTSVMRGPLVRMSVGRSTPRVDLHELGTARLEAAALLDHLLLRNERPVVLDPAAFGDAASTTELRLHSLYRHTVLYRRDTGIDGLYLGFPFLLWRDPKTGVRTRIAPLLLWPARLDIEIGARGRASLAFDSAREEVRLNPALEGIVGTEAMQHWRRTVDELLGRSALRTADVMDGFGLLAAPRERSLQPLPGLEVEAPAGVAQLACSAVLFHVTFMGQAIGEDLRALRAKPLGGTGLETMLRLNTPVPPGGPAVRPPEADRYFTVHSDPSQEAAVLLAREAPGLLVEGPPGTGKSQTIVNMVADAIGQGRSLLIVCQKHAALEVVHKRLVAEGLEHRVVMVNDVNRDRAAIIRGVRSQLEQLRGDASSALATRRRRDEVAARIEAIEGELDRHHEALHRVDARLGLSYRALLGELVALEAAGPPLDVPALRPLLQPLDGAGLSALEEECGPMARRWLPARHEGSPLAELRAFAPDRATLDDFTHAFERFARCERERARTVLGRPAGFELDDPTPHRAWLTAHAGEFLELSDARRGFLAKWLRHFNPEDGAPAAGPAWAGELRRLRERLVSVGQAGHDPLLSPVLCRVPPAELARLAATAAYVATPVAGLGRVNPLRWLRRRRLAGFLRQAGYTPTPQRLGALHAALQLEQHWRPARAALAELHQRLQLPPVAADAGPALLADASATLEALERVQQQAAVLDAAPLRHLLARAALDGTHEAMQRLFGQFDAAFARCEARRLSLAALASLDPWCAPGWIERSAAGIAANAADLSRVEAIEQALPTLTAYQRFRVHAERLGPMARKVFVQLRTREPQLDAVAPDDLDETVRRILRREARLAWKREMEQAAPELHLDRADLESKVHSLAGLDADMRRLNRELLRDNVARERVRPLREWEDITRLTGQRARRLREFVELGAGLGLMALRPVWLMNPDVASRVLPPRPGLFDTVIYDEASQMPVEHALPTLFRARVCVVSGDEKQMPPTAFFTSRVENDEAQAYELEQPDEAATEAERETLDEAWNRREIKDCPDLLQLGRTALPSARLEIHYRSAYRELINYSNAAFYGNQLSVPVRHPESTVREARPIEFVRVDGIYQEQTNPAEAERVVEILAGLWRRPPGQRPSVGVVTFNRKQAELIEEALEARSEQDEDFRAAYRQERERDEEGEDMGVFVKNVENVQGDERDVIVFSSTFGRNRQGSFLRNFGVLGQRGGERRLNVAVTRARRKVVMVTSMPLGEISDLLTTHRVPARPRDFLQGYMEYARAVSDGEFDAARAWLRRCAAGADAARPQHLRRAEDGFSRSVADFVRAMGHRLASTDEADAFGLDFAVEDPASGLYAIGIECDAPRHPLLRHARAREVWRAGVLQRAVPAIHRVSSHGWYHDADTERRRLRAAIDAALTPSPPGRDAA